MAIFFAAALFRHWRQKRHAVYLAWWAAGVALYGAGTFTESLNTLFGWHEAVFRAWYIFGALLGAAPLAQGTVYLLLPKRIADRLSAILLALTFIAAFFVLLTPIDYTKVEPGRLSGRVMEWRWVRYFSPFINLYALVFLVGGAAHSAWRYWTEAGSVRRVWGNVLIATGALLPGLGGTLTRFGQTEWLYVTEFIALVLIWAGYVVIRNDAGLSVHASQKST